MSPHESILTRFLLEQIETQPLARRIVLGLALANETSDKGLANRMRVEAAELEQIDARHRQLVLDFQRRAEG